MNSKWDTKNNLHQGSSFNVHASSECENTLWYNLTDEQMAEEIVGKFSFIVIENNVKVTRLKKGAELTFEDYDV
jgi:hypothetical protein